MNAHLGRKLKLVGWSLAGLFDLYLIVRLFLLIDRYSVNLLYWDNFDYYFLLEGRWNFWQRFTAQLGPHREGFGMLLSSVLAPLTGWNMRAEAFAIGVILVLAAHVCLWMKAQAFGKLAWWDLIVIPGFFLNTIQYEIWSCTVNTSHGTLPLLFLMLWCLAWTISSGRLRLACLLAIDFFAVFTGFGFFIGIVTPIVLGITRKWIGLVVSLAWLALFFVNYRFDPANPTFKLMDPALVHMPEALALGLSHAANFIYEPSNLWLGYGLLIAILAAAVVPWRGLAKGEPQSVIVTSCIAFTILFMLFAAAGRLSYGVPCLTASRYMPLIIPGFVGAYCRIIAMKDCPIKTVLTLIAIGVALNMSVKINPSDLKMMCDFRLAKREWLLTYETTNNLDKTNHSGFRPIYPDPIPADFQSKLDYLRDHRLNFYADGAVDPLFRP